jgi:hypothetical protein
MMDKDMPFDGDYDAMREGVSRQAERDHLRELAADKAAWLAKIKSGELPADAPPPWSL